MHSVLERSPRHLIHEIILVDDGSVAPHTKEPLEEYVATVRKSFEVLSKDGLPGWPSPIPINSGGLFILFCIIFVFSFSVASSPCDYCAHG